MRELRAIFGAGLHGALRVGKRHWGHPALRAGSGSYEPIVSGPKPPELLRFSSWLLLPGECKDCRARLPPSSLAVFKAM